MCKRAHLNIGMTIRLSRNSVLSTSTFNRYYIFVKREGTKLTAFEFNSLMQTMVDLTEWNNVEVINEMPKCFSIDEYIEYLTLDRRYNGVLRYIELNKKLKIA